MSYTVSAENILCETLVKEGEGVSFQVIRIFSEIAQTKLPDCYFDISARSIYAVIDAYSDIFVWEHEQIKFTKYYSENLDEVKQLFERRLPRKVRKAFDDITLPGI